MSPCLLAIDTSTERMALALCWPQGCLTRVEAGGAQASAALLPLAGAMLAQAGLVYQDIDAFAFGAGPGAFTGLRTACAVAQGLAYATQRPVLPLDSLMLVAEDAMPSPRSDIDIEIDSDLWVAMDARMDEVYAAAYRRDGAAQAWQVRAAPALYTLPALAALWAARPPAAVAGSAIEAFSDRLPLGAARLHAQEGDRAAALARLARQAWQRGAGIDAAQALPIYLRDKVALTTDERALRAAAGSAIGTGNTSGSGSGSTTVLRGA